MLPVKFGLPSQRNKTCYSVASSVLFWLFSFMSAFYELIDTMIIRNAYSSM